MTGSKYLLDTNAVIAFQRNETAVIDLLSAAEEVLVPLTVVGELYFGAYKSTKREENLAAVNAFVTGRVVLRPDITTANTYGEIKAAIRAKGRPIPENDIWIAAIAVQYDLTLLTRDEHFKQVAGLKLKNWS